MKRFWAILLAALMCVGIFAGAIGAFLQADSEQKTAEADTGPVYTTREKVYADAHPDLDAADIRERVWLGLDQPLYENASVVSDPDVVTVFLNRHWRLPEGYECADLKEVEGTGKYLRTEAADAFMALQQELGTPVYIVNGYMNAAETQALYESVDPSVADQILFPAGFSDYETGLACDVIFDVNEPDLNAVTQNPEYERLVQLGKKYGFIVPFAEETEEVSETRSRPYHFRYVGPEAAASMGSDFNKFSYENR